MFFSLGSSSEMIFKMQTFINKKIKQLKMKSKDKITRGLTWKLSETETQRCV